MFNKPFHIKSQTVLKGSDRKRIRALIISQSPLFTNEILSEIIPQKSDVQQAKVSLHNGEPAIIFLSAKQPVFFQIGNSFYPTVYTLWNHPECVNIFSTWQPVISKLYGGADLMLPGVVIQTELTADTLSHITAGSAVSVAAVGNRAALAVGETCMSGDSMYKAGMRGKGVVIRHFYGDQLWAMGSKVTPPNIAEIVSSAASPGVIDTIEQKTEKVQISDGDELVQDRLNDVKEEVSLTAASAAAATCPEECPPADTAERCDRVKVNENEFDGLAEDVKLYRCFLFALKKKVKVTQLPMLTSAFFRDCIQVCCPAGSSIDIKKTSYKKLMPFLMEMKKQGFLEVKETAKGVHSLTELNLTHDEVQSFRPWKLAVKEDTQTDSTQEYVYNPPVIIELLAVNSQTLPLFSYMGVSKGSTLRLPEMRRYVTDYVKKKSLQHPENDQLVVLDHLLTQAVVTRKEGYVEHLKWNILFERLSNTLSAVYKISYPNGFEVVKKGKPSPINVKLETRTGNKKVTLINNLDKFGIDVKELAKELRSVKACNTSIQDSQGGQQILAQGNHASFIYKLLKDKYRIPIKYLDIPM